MLESIFQYVLGIAFLGCITYSACIPWLTHLEMTKKNSEQLKWVGYSEFTKQFKLMNWTILPSHFKNSFFHKESDSEIHASIFRINGMGLRIRTPIEYFFVCRFLIKNFQSDKYPIWFVL